MDESKKMGESKKLDESKVNVLNRLKAIGKGRGFKKDNFLIMILLGVLLLVIVWPVPKNQTGQENTAEATESGISDGIGGILNLSDDTGTTPGYKSTAADTALSSADESPESYAMYLEHKLEEIVSVMDGAGETRVMITLVSSEEAVVEKDMPLRRAGTTEVDAEGGSRNTSDIETGQETVYVSDGNGNNVPYIRKTLHPVIGGVVVVTQGGGNREIIQNITEAIVALFGIDEHKIKIVKMIS